MNRGPDKLSPTANVNLFVDRSRGFRLDVTNADATLTECIGFRAREISPGFRWTGFYFPPIFLPLLQRCFPRSSNFDVGIRSPVTIRRGNAIQSRSSAQTFR